MNKDFKYILFDLDGTLTDSAEGITKAVQYALKHFGIDVPNITDLNKFIGPPLKDSYKRFYGFDDDKAQDGLMKFREYYEDKGLFENRVYDGIEEVLKTLKENDKTLIVATSKPEVHAQKILEHFDLAKYFDFIGGADLAETRVKKGDVVRYALQEAGVEDISKAVMIGDREHDIIGGKENNLKTIGVLYGFGDVIELTQARADYIAKEPKDILEILL